MAAIFAFCSSAGGSTDTGPTLRAYMILHDPTWRFPKRGLPLAIIHFRRIFQYKLSIFGYLDFRKPLHVAWAFAVSSSLLGRD